MPNRSGIAMHLLTFQSRLHQDVFNEYAVSVTKVEQLFTDIELASTSNLLTPAGRADAIARLREKTRTELLPPLEKRLKVYDSRLEQLTAEALPVRRVKDQTQQLAEMEIRGYLSGNDPLQNQLVLLDAIDNGDHLTVGAILDAAPFFKMLTPDGRQQAIDRLAAKSPVAAEIELLKNERVVHTALKEAIVHDIATAGATGQPGPRAQGPPAPAA
jgi:hypothetical protein